MLLTCPQVLPETEPCLVQLHLFGRDLLDHVSVKSCWAERSASQFTKVLSKQGRPLRWDLNTVLLTGLGSCCPFDVELSVLSQEKSPSNLVSGCRDSHHLSVEKRMGKKGERIGLGVFFHGITRTTDSNLTLENSLPAMSKGSCFTLKLLREGL